MQSKYRRILALLLLLIFLVLVIYALFNYLTFRVVSTDPHTDRVSTVSPFFKINFNKGISAEGLTVSSPQDIIGPYSTSGRSLIITFKQSLENNRQYMINVGNIKSLGGKTIRIKSFSFVAKYLPENQLSLDQRNAILKSQQQYQNTLQMKSLIQLLPFTGGGLTFRVDYQISYSNNKPNVVILDEAPNQSGQQAGIQWIKSLGYNPKDYNIRYVTTNL